MNTIAVPKFRSCRRLVEWMSKHWHDFPAAGLPSRLSPEREQVFFKSKESEGVKSACLAQYAGWAGKLSSELENLLRPHHEDLVTYLRSLHSRGIELDPSLMNELSGQSRQLYMLAKHYGRLPEHLEKTFAEPRFAYLYAKEVLRGRLPLEVEQVFFKDTLFAAKYAFDVIRGFSSVRLPEALHAFMVMKSFESPNDSYIRSYIDASENDPDRVGNTTVKV
jgi:hypothetical protein